MKTSELTGALLDYWVARAEGFRQVAGRTWTRDNEIAEDWAPSMDWAQGGPLIEKYMLAVRPANHWAADNFAGFGDGNTPLVAICRAVVRAKFGDEVPEQ